MAIEDINNLRSSQVAQLAFESHVNSYWDSGLGELPLSDLAYIGLTPDFKEWIPGWGNYAGETWGQASAVLTLMSQNGSFERLAGEAAENGPNQTVIDISSAIIDRYNPFTGP